MDNFYDLIVIGGGPAGYLACERAAHAGLKTLLFEVKNVGGVCLNEGCIPTKTLLYSAKIKDNAAHGDAYGVKCQNPVIDQEAVVKRKDKVVNMLTGGIAAALKGLGVEWIRERAIIKGHIDGGYKVRAGAKDYAAKRLLLASGSEAAMPPIKGLKQQHEEGFVATNREILNIRHIPDKLIVIGGGVIGMEMASYFNSAGSHVTVIEMLDQIGGPIDAEISKLLMKAYKKKGVDFILNAKVTEIKPDGIEYELSGGKVNLPANKVLAAIGRRPNTDLLGLENIGVTVERGAVVVDEHMQTNQQNVYAAGDITGKSMLAHTAYREAEVAVNNMLGIKDVMKYNAIPGVIYTNPEVATVGETEESAKQKGIDTITKSISMLYSGRYVAENEGGDGICKIVVDKNRRTLIGVHMIANYSSELIWGADALIARQVPIDAIKKIVFPHPTVCEIIREAVFSI